MPSDSLKLKDFKVNGHEINFNGSLCMAFRTNKQNELIAFEGENCNEVTIDGIEYSFSDKNIEKIAFAPSLKYENEIELFLKGESTVNIPLPLGLNREPLQLEDKSGGKVKFEITDMGIQIKLNSSLSGQWLSLKMISD